MPARMEQRSKPADGGPWALFLRAARGPRGSFAPAPRRLRFPRLVGRKRKGTMHQPHRLLAALALVVAFLSSSCAADPEQPKGGAAAAGKDGARAGELLVYVGTYSGP